jgi:energy-coupling factor transporter ATP-binding protein EcfA2
MIAGLSKQDAARKREEAQARPRFQELTKRIEALDELGLIVGAGVGELHRKRLALEREVTKRTSSLAEVESAAVSLPADKAIRRKMLSRAVKEWTEQVGEADELAEAARKALAAFELTQNLLSSLQQRLRSSAQEIIQHTGDRTHCPLCRAKYSEAELNKIFEDAGRGRAADVSDRLRSELQAAEAVHSRRVSELRALRALERNVQTDPAKTSVDAAIRGVTSDREQVATLISEMEATRIVLEAQKKKGRTFERLIELSSAAGVTEGTISSERIDSLRAALRDEQTRLLDALQTLEADGEKSQARLAEIGVTYELKNPTAAELSRAVSERKQAAEDKRRATVALRNQLRLEKLSATFELETRLREVQDLSVRLRTAAAKEQQDSDAIARESKLVVDAVAEIEGLRVKLRRVDSAAAVIQDLLSKQSERFLAETVLRENAVKIASTFAKIQAPDEFDLVVNGGLTIVRRGGSKVELDEMSSGQRAAYALSLFLAMNGRLRTGPKALLFDDPVAHVDDINTLSLLDHLRDIALSGQRQIFFATADSKIGALFGRKFRFLGDRFRQIELARN